MGSYAQLDSYRFVVIPAIPGEWAGYRRDQLPRKLEMLVQGSSHWKTVIKAISDQVMPLYPDYESCYIPSDSSDFDDDSLKVKKELIGTSLVALDIATNLDLETDGLEELRPASNSPKTLLPSPVILVPSSSPPVQDRTVMSSSTLHPLPSPVVLVPNSSPTVQDKAAASSSLPPPAAQQPNITSDNPKTSLLEPSSSSSDSDSPGSSAEKMDVDANVHEIDDGPSMDVDKVLESKDGEKDSDEEKSTDDDDEDEEKSTDDDDEDKDDRKGSDDDDNDNDEDEDEEKGSDNNNDDNDKDEGINADVDEGKHSEKGDGDGEKSSDDDDEDGGKSSDDGKEEPLRKKSVRFRKETVAGRLSRRSDVIGHLPKIRIPKKAKNVSENQDENDKADDELESEEETTQLVVNKGKGGQGSVHQDEDDENPAASSLHDSQTESGLQLEASALLRPGTFTSSGLDVDEARRVLGAVLGLSPEERAAFLTLSHEELLESFKKQVKKQLMKDREVEHMQSPPRKKSRHRR